MKLLLATRNPHKVTEFREMLAGLGLELLCVADMPGLPEVNENGDTFEQNAVRKAAALSAATGLWTLADDSGLEVDALDGAPGVHSARYAGRQGDDAANNARLLRDLDGILDRRARFRCVLALCAPDGTCRSVEGSCQGRILEEARGSGGFGYDPLFLPDGMNRSFAELSEAAKNRISHRARAVSLARATWSELLSRISSSTC